MSKTETATTMDEGFASKLGIRLCTPSTFAELIELNVERVPVTAIGPSGIGKTAIPKQVAARRNGGRPYRIGSVEGIGVPYVALHMPTMSLEDFHVPTFSPDTHLYYDRRVSRRFKPLVDWVEKVKSENKGKVPDDLVPILAFEELNRAVDKSVTRAAFTMLDDRVLGDSLLDGSIQFVITMNPSGGGMSVNEFERDPAMRRRLGALIGVNYDYGSFMAHATAAKFHPSVLAHLGAQPSHGYDEQAAAAGKMFACPATWEIVSRICRRFDELGKSILSTAGRAAIEGAVGVGSADHFLDFVKDHTLIVTPDDVLNSYGPETETRKRFKSYFDVNGGDRLDKVTDLTMGLAVKIFSNLGRPHEEILKPLSWFFGDLPTEIMMAFSQRMVEEANRQGSDAKQYLQTLNQKLAQETPFSDGLKRLHSAKVNATKAAAEAKSKAE
jgi:hypothetical protein